MITLSEAIKIGSAICGAVEKESKNATPQESTYRVRGCGIYALDNLWYDVLPVKVKVALNNDKDAFYKACNWPE